MTTRKALPEPASLKETYDRWVEETGRAIDASSDRNETVAAIAASLYPAYPRGGMAPPFENLAPLQFDPRSVTLEAEYYGEMDTEKFYAVKPLLWLWRLYDRSPFGQNVHLGFLFREMLARRIFARCGAGPRIFEDVTFSFGYNVSLGDDVSIHRHVFIDDRGEVIIGNRVSLSDYANIYSHSHDPRDISNVTLHKTVIEDGARITYHATVLAGNKVARGAIVGTHAVVTREVGEKHISVGVPAKSIRLVDKRGQSRVYEDTP